MTAATRSIMDTSTAIGSLVWVRIRLVRSGLMYMRCTLCWHLLQLALCVVLFVWFFFFFSSRRRHTRFDCDWSSDVCSSDLTGAWIVNCCGGCVTFCLASLRCN